MCGRSSGCRGGIATVGRIAAVRRNFDEVATGTEPDRFDFAHWMELKLKQCRFPILLYTAPSVHVLYPSEGGFP